MKLFRSTTYQNYRNKTKEVLSLKYPKNVLSLLIDFA